MVELRKRKVVPDSDSDPMKKPALSKLASSDPPAITDGQDASESTGKLQPTSEGTAHAKPPTVGQILDLKEFGGTVSAHDGVSTTLEQLVEDSRSGVVLFTYPKASTPGCTTQVCLFRDDYTALTATGLEIFGLSTDSPKSNTTFRTKQNLPYTLLCDPKATLIDAIGFKKSPKGTRRGVFVIDKRCKVLAVEAGGPAATVEVVRKLLHTLK